MLEIAKTRTVVCPGQSDPFLMLKFIVSTRGASAHTHTVSLTASPDVCPGRCHAALPRNTRTRRRSANDQRTHRGCVRCLEDVVPGDGVLGQVVRGVVAGRVSAGDVGVGAVVTLGTEPAGDQL
eukprot:721123-Prymnesium_polylepis.1